jgi:hypothetical protein
VLPSDATVERAADEDSADIVVLLKKRDYTSLPLQPKAAGKFCHCNSAPTNAPQMKQRPFYSNNQLTLNVA